MHGYKDKKKNRNCKINSEKSWTVPENYPISHRGGYLVCFLDQPTIFAQMWVF